MKSASGDQLAPPLVVFQMPPPTPPANMVVGVAGLMTSERIRPPMLPGPSHRHDPGEIVLVAVAAAGRAAAGLPAENIRGSRGAAGVDSSRRARPPHLRRLTWPFAFVYAFAGMRPNLSVSIIKR